MMPSPSVGTGSTALKFPAVAVGTLPIINTDVPAEPVGPRSPVGPVTVDVAPVGPVAPVSPV